MRSDRRDRGGQWDHAFAQLDFGPWPDVPRHPNSVDSFWIHLSHLRRHNSIEFSVIGGFLLSLFLFFKLINLLGD